MNNDKETTHQVLGDLGGMVWHIKPTTTWKHLGYSQRTITKLKNICSDFIPGKGITCLFSGESGTSKTLAAEVIAKELNLNLYRIDLSVVVSKYIGETEKNLRRVFDAAKDSGCILFFDEADALFGKRSDVKDSNNRYANIENNYLLQHIETFKGLAILATNMNHDFDAAFIRCFQYRVDFSDRKRMSGNPFK